MNNEAKVYDHLLGDDCICATSQEEARQFFVEENGDDYEDTESGEFYELSESDLEKRTMFVDENLEERVTYLEQFNKHKEEKTPIPFLFCTSNY